MAQENVLNGGSENAISMEVSLTALKPQLFVESAKADDAVRFYKAAFGAVEVCRTTQPKRKSDQELPPNVVSAELRLAGSSILVSDLSHSSAPAKIESPGIMLCLETEDVEAAVAKAVAAGAVAEGEISEGQGAYCCAGRVGKVKDPNGYVWLICSSSKKYRADVEA